MTGVFLRRRERNELSTLIGPWNTFKLGVLWMENNTSKFSKNPCSKKTLCLNVGHEGGKE